MFESYEGGSRHRVGRTRISAVAFWILDFEVFPRVYLNGNLKK